VFPEIKITRRNPVILALKAYTAFRKTRYQVCVSIYMIMSQIKKLFNVFYVTDSFAVGK